jgi:hypothetical protein
MEQIPPLPAELQEPAKAPSLPSVATFSRPTVMVYGIARATGVSEGNVHRIDVAAVDDTHGHVQLLQTFDDLQ